MSILTPADIALVMSAVELGYSFCEKGMNLQAALERARELLTVSEQQAIAKATGAVQ